MQQPIVLDPSPWPLVHGTRECLDQTTLPTPTTAAGLSLFTSQDIGGASAAGLNYGGMMNYLTGNAPTLPGVGGFNLGDANPVSILTQRISDTEQLLWTSGFQNVQVYRQQLGNPQLQFLARRDHGGFDFRYHGTYSLVAASGSLYGGSTTSFFAAVRLTIYRYTLRGSASAGYTLDRSEITLSGNDELVGLSTTTDGTLISVSTTGTVTALVADGDGSLVVVSTLQLSQYVKVKDPISISNSLAVKDQRIFIVTQQELVRVDVDTVNNRRLLFRWSSIYGPAQPWFTLRLGPGSGSTPTVTRCLEADMVVITDGSQQMNLLYYDANNGAEITRTRVDFGSSVTSSTSEQSVAVRGCQAFVVNNFIGANRIDPTTYCQYAPGATNQVLSAFCNALPDQFLRKTCPAVFGCVANGAATYELQGDRTLRKLWSRDDVTCGTSIPLVTNPQNGQRPLTYCVGFQRGSSAYWALQAFDSNTGSDVFSRPYYGATTDTGNNRHHHRLLRALQGSNVPLINSTDTASPPTTTPTTTTNNGDTTTTTTTTTPPVDDSNTTYILQTTDGVPIVNGLRNFFANPFYAGVESVGGRAIAVGSLGPVILLTPTTTAEATPSDQAGGIRFLASVLVGWRTLLGLFRWPQH